jgi:hypothetical protein
MVNVESDEIGIDISDVNLGTLSKAFKFATRTRLKVNLGTSVELKKVSNSVFCIWLVRLGVLFHSIKRHRN